MKINTASLNLRQRYLYLLTAIILSSLLVHPILVQANDSGKLDRALIRSLAKKKYKSARKLLEKGANPEAIFGSQLSDNAVCTAIDDRGTKYLELLMEFGASANAYFDVKNELRKTPLVCSVYLLNFEAFDLLLKEGADPSVDLYSKGKKQYSNSTTALTMALYSRTYPMALRLLKLYPLHPNELRQMVAHFERSPYDQDHPWNKARDELIAWTKERVPGFNPKIASPSTRSRDECLFTFRDHEDGLKKGSVCWDEEDR